MAEKKNPQQEPARERRTYRLVPSTTKGFRKLVFWLHLICGIAVGLVIFTMSFTGVILTYEKQVTHWADGFEVNRPSSQAPRLGPTALLGRIHAETGLRPTGIQFRSDPEEPARVYFGRRSLAVDPYTGTDLGNGAAGVRGFFRTMIVWHRWLGRRGTGALRARRLREHAISGFSS